MILFALALSLAPAGDGSVWDRLAECESGGNWSANTGNGYSGGLQFSNSTWRAMGGPTEEDWAASREQQIAVAMRLYDAVGWSAWPGCAAALGLSGDPGGSGGGSPQGESESPPEPEQQSDDDSSDDDSSDDEQSLPLTR